MGSGGDGGGDSGACGGGSGVGGETAAAAAAADLPSSARFRPVRPIAHRQGNISPAARHDPSGHGERFFPKQLGYKGPL